MEVKEVEAVVHFKGLVERTVSCYCSAAALDRRFKEYTHTTATCMQTRPPLEEGALMHHIRTGRIDQNLPQLLGSFS